MKTYMFNSQHENIYGVRRRIKRLEKRTKYWYLFLIVAYALGLATQLIVVNIG